MANRVVIDRAALKVYVETSPALQGALRTTAEKLMADSLVNSPFGRSVKWGPIKRRGKSFYSHHHGYFKENYSVVPSRGGFEVWNRDPFAHLMEWGSVKNPTYAPMRRAIRQSGLHYKPNPKSRGA